MNIEQFNPTVAELQSLVNESKKIQSIDINNKQEMAIVTKARISLKNARVAITKKGKELREEALEFQRAVIGKEKELIAIIEPEEDRLIAIEEEAKNKAIREERLQKLPWQKQKLSEIGATVNDETLLSLDDKGFQVLLNEKIAQKYEREQEEKRKIEAEELRKKEIAEAEERARIKAEAKAKEEAERKEKEHKEELERIEKQAKEEMARKERETKEKEEKENKLKAEADNKIKAEAEKLAKEKNYQAWLKSQGYSEDNKDGYFIENHGHCVVLYKLIGTYYPNENN